MTLPYDVGSFPVQAHKHRLFYRWYGHPEGPPIVFIHGGPGAGCQDQDYRFFDLERQRVLLFDQRGAGKSTPFASLEENTTRHLIDDITALLDHFGLEKVYLFGGSWGSTLSLCYAIAHPERVKGMILRGIFLSREKDYTHYLGGGVAAHAPAAWERFCSHVPEQEAHDRIGYYLRQMCSDDPAIRQKYCYEFAFYEFSIAKKNNDYEEVRTAMETFGYESLARIEAHYITQRCFLPENYILDSAHRIRHIPTAIVHGKHDLICLPDAAEMLAEVLDNGELSLVDGGHSSSEPAVEAGLIRAVRKMVR